MVVILIVAGACLTSVALGQSPAAPQVGREVAIARHLADGQEFQIPLQKLIAYGRELFIARFTIEGGAGRPLTKGIGRRLPDPNSPLAFQPRQVDTL